MRLGDLDRLKKKVENLVVGGEKGLKDYYKNGSRSDQNAWIGGVYDCWELIVNSQTVEPICPVDFPTEDDPYPVCPCKPSQVKWIPVSERLPEKKGYFLTSTVFDDVYCDFWNGEGFERTEMILAWMPLPEPYIRGGEEE